MNTPSSLSSLLRSATEEPKSVDEEKLIADIRAALKLVSSNHLAREYSNDLVSLITSATDLLGYTAAPTYPVTTTLNIIAHLQSVLRNLETYIRRAQQTYIGYAIVNQKTSRMLPNLFFNKHDALTHLDLIAPMFELSPLDFTVQEVIYSSVNVGQPLAAPTQKLPIPPLPVEEPTPFSPDTKPADPVPPVAAPIKE